MWKCKEIFGQFFTPRLVAWDMPHRWFQKVPKSVSQSALRSFGESNYWEFIWVMIGAQAQESFQNTLNTILWRFWCYHDPMGFGEAHSPPPNFPFMRKNLHPAAQFFVSFFQWPGTIVVLKLRGTSVFYSKHLKLGEQFLSIWDTFTCGLWRAGAYPKQWKNRA